MSVVEYDPNTYNNSAFIINFEVRGAAIYHFEVKFAHEASGWLNCLKGIKKVSEEASRTKNEKISRNIDPLINFWKNKVIILRG